MKTDYFENFENPFLIDIEDKETYDYDDYVRIQEKLQEKNLDEFLESLYPQEKMRTTLSEMKRRCCKGIHQKIIDLSNNDLLPSIELFKIGNGGDGKNCLVSCRPLFVDRYNISDTIVQSLEEVGFNGYFMLLKGGFPNPTGTEMKYAGVPYSFKIFMILEANKRGFEKVLWVDSVCYAVNNPEPLFGMIEKYDAVFKAFSANCFAPDTCINIVFYKTVQLLNQIFQRDIRNDTNVNSIVFGLNLNSPKIIQFIRDYYEMVKLGLPFLSGFPEEIVFTSIFNNPEYHYLFHNINDCSKLYVNSCYLNKTDAKNNGYYFVQD